MRHRIEVVGSCARPCPACEHCDGYTSTTVDGLLAVECDEFALGGGDATAWPQLDDFLAANAASENPRRVRIEAPARSLTAERLSALATGGVTSVQVQAEAGTPKAAKVLQVGDAEVAVAAAEALGLEVSLRLCVKPRTFNGLLGLAKRMAPRPTSIEIGTRGFDGEPTTLDPGLWARVMHALPHLRFGDGRLAANGYLPPCALPDVWAERPHAWSAVLRRDETPNNAVSACATCVLATRCRWNDPGSLPEGGAELQAIQDAAPKPKDKKNDGRQQQFVDMPAVILEKRPETPLVCSAPWTTVEVTDPIASVSQCCSDWLVKPLAPVTDLPIANVWNGPGYQWARRVMSGADQSEMCLPICPRLHDRKFSEDTFRIQAGTETFVRNQLLAAEDMAERRTIVRARPLRMILSLSSYCNYNCIMCTHGRSPRKTLADEVWDEVPEYLPTLQHLTLLGGEPLAEPRTVKMLREFDRTQYPDVGVNLVTNGSLLTDRLLRKLEKCRFSEITFSLNAGDAETYEQVQRGIALDSVLENIDALMRYRDRTGQFGITLSFCVQTSNAHSLIPFAQLAWERQIAIRLLPLSVDAVPELDFYADLDAVSRVLEHVDQLGGYVESLRPPTEAASRIRDRWRREVRGVRAAIAAEAAGRGIELPVHAGITPGL